MEATHSATMPKIARTENVPITARSSTLFTFQNGTGSIAKFKNRRIERFQTMKTLATFWSLDEESEEGGSGKNNREHDSRLVERLFKATFYMGLVQTFITESPRVRNWPLEEHCAD